jgi:hypothetical protein
MEGKGMINVSIEPSHDWNNTCRLRKRKGQSFFFCTSLVISIVSTNQTSKEDPSITSKNYMKETAKSNF